MPAKFATADFNRKFISKNTPFQAGVFTILEKHSSGLKRNDSFIESVDNFFYREVSFIFFRKVKPEKNINIKMLSSKISAVLI